jgi:hypothetical protein
MRDPLPSDDEAEPWSAHASQPGTAEATYYRPGAGPVCQCPFCQSPRTEPRHTSRRIGGAIGAAAGATSAIALTLSGAEAGATAGLIGGPFGAACGGIAGGGCRGMRNGCRMRRSHRSESARQLALSRLWANFQRPSSLIRPSSFPSFLSFRSASAGLYAL